MSNEFEVRLDQLREEGKQRVVRAQSALDQAKRNLEQSSEERSQIDSPATMLFAKLAVWGRIPTQFRKESTTEISALKIRAKNGDEVAQEVLKGIQRRLLENEIDTKGLPSLDWQRKGK